MPAAHAEKAADLSGCPGAINFAFEGGTRMNLEAVTLQDCMDLYRMKGYCTEISGGKVYGFRAEGEKGEAGQLGTVTKDRKEAAH